MHIPFLGSSATPPVLVLLSLAACSRDYALIEVETPPVPLSLSVTSPSYGGYLGPRDEAGSLQVDVSGVVSPASSQVMVNGARATVDEGGNFSAVVPFAEGGAATDRAFLLDVVAYDTDETAREILPVFDGNDPRETDPGAVNGLLTPSGLDALEPVVADMVDSLGLWEQVSATLPVIDTDYLDITPTGIQSSGTGVDLAPADGAVTLLVTFEDVVMTADLTILDSYTAAVSIGFGEITVGANAIPGLSAESMLTLSLSDAQADVQDVSIAFDDYEVPDWLTQLLVDPLASLVADLGSSLADLVLDQMGTLELGGPFAFSTDLLGTPLSARLAEVDATLDGIALGLTVSTTGDAAETMPELTALTALTPSGLDYQLGFAVHEGLLNTLIDQTLASFLDIEMQLEGEYADLMGAGIANLPGGGYLPNDSEGYCMAFHGGEARVVRMTSGTGSPLAQLWLPDMRVGFQTIQDGVCTDWLDASVFATVDMNVNGTELNMDFNVGQATVLYYGAAEQDPALDLDAVGEGLAGIVNGFVGLALSQASFDLSDMLGGLSGLPITLEPEIVSVEGLGEEGRFGIYMNVF
ncbi:MAG: hypothetical protein EXR69_14805 [Myxococcales bacterium]|nr:hypothetical protein [Myxococcales bacterium]